MDIIYLVLIAIAGIAALVLIIRFLGGCIIKVLLALAVVAVIAFLIFFLLRC